MSSPSPVPSSAYRGRLAPSPTGLLHVGHARTFWSAWLRAREAGGTLVMRMDDLDQERSKQEYADAALEDLHWLGIRWQEGPDKGGPFAPYEQSKRTDLYLAVWRRLFRNGYLFPCRCSRKDLENALGAPHEHPTNTRAHAEVEQSDDEPIYPGTCRRMQWRSPQLPGPTAMEVEKPDGINWRFHIRDGEVVEFDDLNLGPQRFVAGKDFGDFVVFQWRSPRWCAEPTCSNQPRARFSSSRHSASSRRRGITASWCSTTMAAASPSAMTRSACAHCASAALRP
jgi:glutamyl/glutaminyl-tRNA synthetase